ncbi:MAG: ATP-binding cassette domain-containing protein, partial [Clostridiaceae bacterium]|nr:ATP-binding cassette domain-containing protein [Clostridiaceae bacterium]
NAFIAALAGAERIFEVLDTDVETDEGKVTLVKVIKNQLGEEIESEEGTLSWKVPKEDGSVSYVPVRCDIDIKDVTFSYVEGTPVLKHVTTHAESGEKLAFVGSTGAGKTTITNLINRFYDVQDGVITIDSIPINDIKKSSLRSSMAFVLQDSKMFPGTIRDNIRYGKLDATDEEIVAAAKLANASSFIEKLPDGYDTMLNADGVNISMGQAQLLNIARTAIAGKPLLVLDEATSSIDTRTERLIEKGMDKLMADKTVLVIAHRLSTVRNSENIIVLEGGEIIESGNHDELIALGKKYYQLYTGAFEMT